MKSSDLALAWHLTGTYGAEDQFLAVPPAPVTVSDAALEALVLRVMDADGLRHRAEWSRQVDRVPRTPGAGLDATAHVSALHSRVLDGATLAYSAAGDEQRAAYDAARTLLSGSEPGVPSLERTVYEEYRVRVLDLERQLDELDSAAPGRQALEDELTVLQMEWVEHGYKDEVETAFETVRSYLAADPSTAWDDWRTAFDLASQTDLQGADFHEVGAVPSSAATPDLWPEKTLTRAQLAAALDEARASGVGNGASAARDLPSRGVRFRFMAMQLERSWFRYETYHQRYWRLPDTDGVVSDGNGGGTLPAVVDQVLMTADEDFDDGRSSGSQPTWHVIGAGTSSIVTTGPTMTTSTIAVTNVSHAASAMTTIGRPRPTFRTMERRFGRPHSVAAVRSASVARFHTAIKPRLSTVATLHTSTAVSAQLLTQLLVDQSPKRVTGARIVGYLCRPLPAAPQPDPSFEWPS